MTTESSDSWSSIHTPTSYVKMKVAYFSNEFPQDELKDLLRRLYLTSRLRKYCILSRFIEEATIAIRKEVRELPVALRTLIPPFNTIFDFADQVELRNGPLGASIDGVLLCAVELATLIGHFETRDEPFGFDPTNDCLTGLGIGLLASAAVSLSPTLVDIPLAGAEVVRIAFRLGIAVHEVSQNLQPTDLTNKGAPETWAYVIPDLTADEAQQELDAIHARSKTPESSKVFISASSHSSITVSGPPSRLKDLFRLSEFFRDRKFVALPVYGGLCHAKHIYSWENVHEVVGKSSLDSSTVHFSPRIPVLSTSTGRPFPADDATSLLEQIISEILTQPISWDTVIHGIIERASSNVASDCSLLAFRVSLPVNDLIKGMEGDAGNFKVSTEDLVQWTTEESPRKGDPRGPSQSKIAIVGMACRMPGGATDTEKFWDILEKGLDVHKRIPADRFDVETHYDSTGKRVNTSQTPYGCFIEEPGLFDAPFFNMSPREAQQTDPMQRLALVTAYEALEQAGYVANRTSATNLHRIGTFYGQASDDYREVNTAQEISTYFIPGGCRAFGPGRINYFFKFSGPSYSIDTACSSSLATIQTACTSLWNGETDTVVAGGMNVLTNSDAFAGLCNGHFLSKTPNACKTWDCEADGYCRADGVGSIVMKRLEDAEADNDNILGVILGAGTNHSAEAISITHPHAGAQSYLYRQVLNNAGIDPLDVSFVEMHGTGTQAGDTVEIKSVTDVFAPLTRRRSPKNPLHIGAVKSNYGHGEAVAGVTALLKVLLMFQKDLIPPHVGIKNSINPAFPKDLDKRNLKIPYQKTPWIRTKGKKRVAIVNNFSAAGGNTTIAIEEGHIRERSTLDPRPSHVIGVSAKSKISLKGNIERLIAYLDAHPDTSLSDLSYSTMARRYHHTHRVAIATSDATHLKKKLVSCLSSVETHKPISSTGPPPIAFAFTGQGASYKSMNLELFHESPYFRSQILHLDSLARRQGLPSFLPAIDGSHPKDHPHRPVITQVALVCTEIALAKYWGTLGVTPDVVIGHSLGEYAALHVAGVLSASDTIFLVGQRARMLEERCQIGSHKMLAVRAALVKIQETAVDIAYEVACINGPEDTVLSGPAEQIDTLAGKLEAAGLKCFSLDVAFAFHSAQTDPILDEFQDIASSGVLFQAPNLPIISPLLGKVLFDDKTVNASYVRRATREPVDFLSALRKAQDIQTVDETTVWVEIGPHPVCMGFVKSTLPTVHTAVPSFRRTENNWTTITQSLGALHEAGVAVSWSEYHRPFEGSLRLLNLPSYSWNDKNYWIQYNGDWALTKGNTFYDAEKALAAAKAGQITQSAVSTSTVQQIVEEEFQGSAGRVVMRSDLMLPDFRAAVYGHLMNDCGVATSSIHADVAFTLGKYLYTKLKTGSQVVHMDVTDLEVIKGLVARKDTSTPQLIEVSISTTDINSRVASLSWHTVGSDGATEDAFASAGLVYGDADEWLSSWIPATHLVQGRIEALERLAEEGVANRLSHNMAYRLFAQNLVDYGDKYRGMQSVVLHGLEAFADVVLSADKGGIWTVPPFFIDSVSHIAGFVMNVSDAVDTKNNFCVTPGWGSMRFARPLAAGGRYRSYVKMIPTTQDPSVYLGDVYILQDGVIIGMTRGIKFRRYPRILLDRFFSAPDKEASKPQGSRKQVKETPKAVVKIPSKPVEPKSVITADTAVPAGPADKGVEIAPNTASNSDSTAANAIQLVAAEAGLDVAEMQDDSRFENLGVDSLMSLVIAEKFREELGVTVSGSLFLEYPTVGDLRAWLMEYYS